MEEPSSPFVLALDFGGTKIAAAVASRNGRRLGQTSIATEPAAGPRPNLDRALAAARRLLDETVPGRRPSAVAATTFGIPSRDGISLAPAIDGWERVELARELEDGLGCELVRVATDVKAAAAAEARDGALAGADPGLYLNLGTGLAVALVVGGRVVLGADGAAGEIGYHLLAPNGAARGVPVLEDLVSGIGLAAEARRRVGQELTAADVFARERSEPRLAELVDEFVRHLSFHLVNLAVTVNPARIAVGGGLVRSWERLEAPLREALDAHVPYPPELVPGRYPYDAALEGAIALALEALAETEQFDHVVEPSRT